MTKTEYRIIGSSDYDQVQKEIELRLECGWKLQGGIAIVANDGGSVRFYAQAIVREYVEDV
jgi:hypothetical protein